MRNSKQVHFIWEMLTNGKNMPANLFLLILACNICVPVTLKILLLMYFMCGNLSQDKQLI